MSKASYGQVDIELGGETVTLKPTLRAFEEIEKRYGGSIPAMQALASFGIGPMLHIIAAATNTGQKYHPELKQKIFDAGIRNLSGKVTEYLDMLTNPTGKDKSEIDAEQGDEGN